MHPLLFCGPTRRASHSMAKSPRYHCDPNRSEVKLELPPWNAFESQTRLASVSSALIRHLQHTRTTQSSKQNRCTSMSWQLLLCVIVRVVWKLILT
eukprot:5436955-Pyramimonas_sp.AAC.1